MHDSLRRSVFRAMQLRVECASERLHEKVPVLLMVRYIVSDSLQDRSAKPFGFSVCL